MPDRQWQLLPPHLHPDMRFQLALLVAHRRIYDRHFAQEPSANPALGFHLYDYRRTDGWRIVVILTPWMLSRLLFPEQAPDIPIPEGWSAEERRDCDYQLLGPAVALAWDGGDIKAHLNYQEILGHYLLQPIALDMQQYDTPESALSACDKVIMMRDESMRLAQQSGS